MPNIPTMPLTFVKFLGTNLTVYKDKVVEHVEPESPPQEQVEENNSDDQQVS